MGTEISSPVLRSVMTIFWKSVTSCCSLSPAYRFTPNTVYFTSNVVATAVPFVPLADET